MTDTEKPIGEEFNSLLSDVKKFLMQEQDLFGSTLYPESPKAGPPKTVPPVVRDDAASVSETPYPNEPWTSAGSLKELNEQICNCMKCPLGATRTKFVFGVGNPNAKVVVVGEAPGADEDAQGEPFVGRAGQLLNKILEAINFKRDEVFICNILKCRPPNNRDPLPEEVGQCEPYLWKQLEILHPMMILAVGRIAGQTLLKTTRGLGELRGKVHLYHGIPMVVTYHPAALLRNPNWKRPTWEDVQMFRAMYDGKLKESGEANG